MINIPTLQDIALKSGFSKSTVSLALRRHPRIPAATRRCIEQVAEQIGYRPDPALARIAANRFRRVSSRSTVAFITTDHPTSGVLLDTGSLAGARLRGELLGYQIEHFRFEDYGSAKRLGEVIYSRGIKGVIIGKLSRPDFCAEFPWAHFAAVACDSGFYRPPLLLVMPDHAHAVHRAWQEAVTRGYQRIGLVLFNEYNAVDYFDKMSAYLYNQRLLPARDRLNATHIDPRGPNLLQEWIDRERPDVILGFNPLVAFWLRKLGYALPADLGFIGLMAGGNKNDSAARLEENFPLLGQIALDQLDILIRTNQFGLPKHITTLLIESTWNPGTTLREPPPPAEATASRPFSPAPRRRSQPRPGKARRS